MSDAAKQPNILFIMADQMAAPVLKTYGGKTAKTPNLDKMAAAGVVLNLPTVTVLCVPRAAMC
nr:sulfatase-like hydrolase/transferase [Aliamphritea spongicola]